MIGNDAMNTPPAHALAQRSIVDNVRGYCFMATCAAKPAGGDYSRRRRRKSRSRRCLGPNRGIFAAQDAEPLSVIPVKTAPDDASQEPMAFDISMGVRKGDVVLKQEVEQALARERPAVDAILAQYHVVRVPE